MEKIKITLADGSVEEIYKGTKVLSYLERKGLTHDYSILGVKINNHVRDLLSEITEDCHLDFLTIHDNDGFRIYLKSLMFLLIKAASETFPDTELTIKYNIDKFIYCEFQDEKLFIEKDIQLLKEKMMSLVAEDIPITREEISVAEITKLFERNKQYDKVNILKYLHKDKLNIYNCGWLRNYFYDYYMVPSTGYIKNFALKYYMPGFILRYPARKSGEISEFKDFPKLFSIFREADEWTDILGINSVGDLNEEILNGNPDDLIRISEAFHEKKIAEIADIITERKDDINLILLSGPSSSGRRTFSRRLAIQMRINGLEPVPISLDDYLLPGDKLPITEMGDPDFESLESFDLELFNEHLAKLLQGADVEIPTYNFKTLQREYTGRKVININKNHPLMIEGDHCLNNKLTESIPQGCKFKIYISPLSQLNLDGHNPIYVTDARIIRKIVQNHLFRDYPAQKTIRSWGKIREGEEKYIFPFQESADIMINTHLVYELAVLKSFAQPLLEEITDQEPEYSEASHLLKFLSFFLPLQNNYIPKNSILREFIGADSC